MDVLLTEEEKMVRQSAREFLEAECPTTLVREMETDPKGYPPALWRKVAELARGPMAAGTHALTFHADNLPSGVYFYALTGPDVRVVRSMILLK